MAGRINREDIETLRERADAEQVIGDYTPLRRAGRNLKGLCPFHTEKTPSFNVMPDEGRWYCFGCSEGGDLIDFLRRIEGLDFVEAVEELARRTGFNLRYEQLSARERQAVGEKQRMLGVTRAAMAWFEAQLMTPGGAVAREYLKGRGFGREDAARFHLGFAPDSWDALARHLTEVEGFDRQDVVGVRLAKPNNRGGLMDTFRGRLVFPVLDVKGEPIGFGGRVLPGIDYGDFNPPKYLNSPEYRLYQKTHVLYGLYEARAAIVAADEVLVCEGYTDVMALHQAGFANAVATCGTAVGPDHFRKLSKYANRVVLAFDGDEAGQKAARRAFDAAREVDHEAGGKRDFTLRVLVLEEGTDPAELVRDHGVGAMRERVAAAPDVVPFLVERLATGSPDGGDDARVVALREAVELLGLERDLDRRRGWARTVVAAAFGVSLEHVLRTADRLGVDLDAHVGVARSAPTTDRSAIRGTPVARAQAVRERTVLRFALQRPEQLPEEWYELGPEDIHHPRARAVFDALNTAGGPGVPLVAMLDAAPDEDTAQLLQELAVDEPVVPDSREAVVELLRAMLAEAVERQVATTREELARVNYDTDWDRVIELQRALQLLEDRRRRLRAEPRPQGVGGAA